VVRTEVADEPATDLVPWVLLVVTDEGERPAARRVWEDAGFGVELASSVEDALDCLSVMTPSLVVVDDRLYRPVRQR
jgi:ActR/RegA family two-component response regulator